MSIPQAHTNDADEFCLFVKYVQDLGYKSLNCEFRLSITYGPLKRGKWVLD